MRDVFDQWAVLISDRLPIKAMHVSHIKEIPITSPHFIKDGGPFFTGHAIHHQPLGRNIFLILGTGLGIITLVFATRADEDLFAIRRENITICAFEEDGGFAFFELEDMQGRLHTTITSVVESA